MKNSPSNMKLRSPHQANDLLDDILVNGSAQIEINEDLCFGSEEWLKIGEIEKAPTENASSRSGGYSCKIRSFQDLSTDAYGILQLDDTPIDGPNAKVNRALEAILHCAVRCGMIHPTLDALIVRDMPFRHPTTIVADTCAVLHGALNFAVRFLYPMARIKIPALVQMEIVNNVDRYFTLRRKPNLNGSGKASALLEHTVSQGGQRVLLRLELQTDAEIERARLGADPLRGIVQPDKDQEDKNLGLQNIQRSFADRLIVETAIQHRDRVSAEHPIYLLTNDQGLSRMALAEGLGVLYYSLPQVDSFFGRTTTGVAFKPFHEEQMWNSLLTIPLSKFIWDLAATFGNARLRSADGEQLTISAIGENLTWFPYYSKDDLLWTRWEDAKRTTNSRPESQKESRSSETEKKISDASKNITTQGEQPSTGSYKLSVQSLINLVLILSDEQVVSERDAMKVVNIKSSKTFANFRNFLLSGSFIKTSPDSELVAKVGLSRLRDGVINLDLDTLSIGLQRVNSYKRFLDELENRKSLKPSSIESISKSSLTTYRNLAEIAGDAIRIGNIEICRTNSKPSISEFVEIAIGVFEKIAQEDRYILTGAWLEAMARERGIHPARVRARLEEAAAANMLIRYTEGSTPETSFPQHKMAMIETVGSKCKFMEVNLYHGDFLIPGKASVSLRLERSEK